MAVLHKCPGPKCEIMVAKNLYACPTHWASLTPPIRARILKGFRSSARGWMEANKEALAYWAYNNKTEPTKEPK